jgi:hypothetical protein
MMELLFYGFLAIFISFILFYATKKPIFSIKSDNKFDFFLKNVSLHMRRYHPKIPIDYSFVKLFKNEKNLKIRETIVVQEIVSQFYSFHFAKTTQEAIPKEKLWPTYVDNPKTPSYPNDWLQRKEFAYVRDLKSCKRCGKNLLSLNEVYNTFVRPIESGGSYNFENIITLCIDCNKILNSNNQKSSTINSLKLYDELLDFIVD